MKISIIIVIIIVIMIIIIMLIIKIIIMIMIIIIINNNYKYKMGHFLQKKHDTIAKMLREHGVRYNNMTSLQIIKNFKTLSLSSR